VYLPEPTENWDTLVPYTPVQLPPPTEDWSTLTYEQLTPLQPTPVYSAPVLPEPTENWDNETWRSAPAVDPFYEPSAPAQTNSERQEQSVWNQSIDVIVSSVDFVPEDWEELHEAPLLRLIAEPDPAEQWANEHCVLPCHAEHSAAAAERQQPSTSLENRPTILIPRPSPPQGYTNEELLQFPTLPEKQPYYRQTISAKTLRKIAASRERLGLPPLPTQGEIFQPQQPRAEQPAVQPTPQPAERPARKTPLVPAERELLRLQEQDNRLIWDHPYVQEANRIQALHESRTTATKHRRSWQSRFPKENILVYDNLSCKLTFITRKERIADFTSQRFRYDHWVNRISEVW
jgi:hypothetical protein